MKVKQIALVIGLLSAAAAQAEQGDVYATMGLGMSDNEIKESFKTETGDHVRDSIMDEFAVGYYIHDRIALEAAGVFSPGFQSSSNPDVTQYRLNALYFFNGDMVKPYLTTGWGREKLDVPGSSQADHDTHLFSYGAGLQFNSNENLFARAEFRIDEMTDESNEHGVFMLELGYRFGAKPAPVITTAVAKPVIEEKPAPAPVVVEQPAPVVVPVVVMPMDGDEDGVIDDNDKCPDTIKGAKVNEEGCAVFEGNLKGVNFDSGSANLTTGARIVLDNVASEMKKFPELKVEIGAHTDSQGSDAFNKDLSHRRAASVRTYMLEKGIVANRMTSVGYGEARPIADNMTAAGRAENRRVEFTVVK